MFVPFSTTKGDIIKLFTRHIGIRLINESSKRESVKQFLASFINGENGVIDGTALQKFWFPTEEFHYDVFISHSHNDYDTAVKLASWLQNNCGLSCFVDGFVWKSADQLLKDIDKVYTWHEERGVYDYNERNFSTSHVHAMLSMAIYDIIDRSECCIFIKSDNSISLQGIREKTLSPWLYEELTFMKKGRINVPERYRHLKRELKYFSEGAKMEMLNESQQLKVAYSVNSKDFPTLSTNDLETLENRNLTGLDTLYKSKGILKLIERIGN